MSLRSRAREIVLQILYQDDMNKERSTDEDLPFIRNRLHSNGNIIDFALELLSGVREKISDIDQQLSAVAENWRISRMAATDRNVLRLGAFEILFYETPAKVAINEAIELAKRYGTELSPTFINGILDRLIKKSADPGSFSEESAQASEAPSEQETTSEDENPVIDPPKPESILRSLTKPKTLAQPESQQADSLPSNNGLSGESDSING